ncbi:hypothetical protein D1007_04275 [Hordeum vulgare]|nr:hypothetical protein D1007_04275 [Hordeum vulgare]
MHFNLDFGLSANCFVRWFLEFYSLQITHLGTNSILYLANYATLCVGYFGFWPLPSLFHTFFHFHAQKNKYVSYASKGVVLYAWQNVFFPRMKFIESFKKWQRTFFYVWSVGEGHDWVNLPLFIDVPPAVSNSILETCTKEIIGILSRL